MENNINLNFCQNLRHLRMVHNLTQAQMAEALGIGVSTLRQLEGCTPPVRVHCDLLCRVCQRFHVSMDEILYENWPEMFRQRYREQEKSQYNSREKG